VSGRFSLHVVHAAIRYFGARVMTLVLAAGAPVMKLALAARARLIKLPSAVGRALLWVLSWPLRWDVAGWTLLVTLITLVLMYHQIELANEQIRLANEQTRLAQEQTTLAREQTALAQRQTVIIEKQDELLSRRAEMNVSVAEEKREADGVLMLVTLKNTGKKAADGFYWHLFFPPSLEAIKPSEASVGERVFGGVAYKHYRGHVAPKLYPTRSYELAQFKLMVPKDVKESTTIPVSIRWQIVTDDGVFPQSPSDEPGVLNFFMVLNVPAAKTPAATPPNPR
jgi:hypothetical protein